MAASVHMMLLTLMSLMMALTEVYGAEFIFGGEAQRVCEAYKLICPAKKVCALQSLKWPRAMKFPVCVHDHQVRVKSKICRKAPQPGKCGAKFVRWYFNVHMEACSWFTYGGCGGNENNFRTAEECERRCMGSSEDGDIDNEVPYNIVDGDEEDTATTNNNDDNNGDLEPREPTLITAPARAPEMIDLNTENKASLNAAASTTTGENGDIIDRAAWKRERRKRRKEARRQKRLRNKMLRRRNRRKQKEASMPEEIRRWETAKPTPPRPTRELTPFELGPNYNNDVNTPNYAEMTGRETTVTDFGDERTLWLMDKRFRRRRRRRRHRNHNNRNNSDNDYGTSRYRPTASTRGRNWSTGTAHTGAKQDTYYDKINLFNILKKQEEDRARDNRI